MLQNVTKCSHQISSSTNRGNAGTGKHKSAIEKLVVRTHTISPYIIIQIAALDRRTRRQESNFRERIRMHELNHAFQVNITKLYLDKCLKGTIVNWTRLSANAMKCHLNLRLKSFNRLKKYSLFSSFQQQYSIFDSIKCL